MSVRVPRRVTPDLRAVLRVTTAPAARVQLPLVFLRVRVPFRLLSVFNALLKPCSIRVRAVFKALSDRC